MAEKLILNDFNLITILEINFLKHMKLRGESMIEKLTFDFAAEVR